MSKSLYIKRFRLWRVAANGTDYERALYHQLICMVHQVAQYYDFETREFLSSSSMSFIDALVSYTDYLGLKALPLEDSKNFSWNFPLIAREKLTDRPVLLLPCATGYVVATKVSMLSTTLNSNNIPRAYDEIFYLVPTTKKLRRLTFGDLSSRISKYFPATFLVALSAIIIFLVAAWFTVSASSLSDFAKYNRWIIAISCVGLTLTLVIALTLKNRMTKKNISVAKILFLDHFYRRLFELPNNVLETRVNRLKSNSFALRSMAANLLVGRGRAIFSLMWLMVIGLLLLSKSITFFLWFLGSSTLVVWAVQWIQKNQATAHRLMTAHEEQTELYLEAFGSAMLAWHATPKGHPLVDKIVSKAEQLLDVTRRRSLAIFCLQMLRLSIPLLYFFTVASYLALTNESLEWFHLAIVVMSALTGAVLVLFAEHHLLLTGSLANHYLTTDLDQLAASVETLHVKPVNIRGRIELVNVSFSYDDSGILVIKNCTLTFDAQKIYVITGPSGVGKSSLVKIMLGLLRPQVGQVIVDGQDLRSLDLPDLRKNFGVVFEDAQLTVGSIYDNIMCGRNLSPKTLEHLLLSHEIFDYLLDLPMGIETYVYLHGKNISRLEKSIIFLARALVHAPTILFLDEILYGLSKEDQLLMVDYLNSLNITRVLVARDITHLSSLSNIINFEGFQR